MLHFTYVATESREEIQFVSKIEIEEKFQAFIGLPNQMYLFVHIDNSLEDIFSLKKFNTESNQVSNMFLCVLNVWNNLKNSQKS